MRNDRVAATASSRSVPRLHCRWSALKTATRHALMSAGLAVATCAVMPGAFAQSMSVDSLDGPVTSNEVNSFVSYINSISPVVWPNTGSMENQYAQGASGEQIKAMGLMYEITGNTAVLNRMISFCDTLLSQRNDLLAAPNGQRTYWNGKISPAWPGQALGTTPVYSTSASGDCVGHLANCAQLILLTPSLWNTTVPDGNPFGYGVTYLDRAKTYVAQADFTFNNCFFPDMLTLNNSGLTNIYCYPAGYPYQPGNQYPWNQAMMMNYPLQYLAIAHELLGDNPSLVTKYDKLVSTNINRFFNDSAGTLHQLVTDSAGNPAYNWSYTPTANAGEDSNHGSLDVAGFYRAYATNRYGVTATQMKPFANMVVDIMTLTVGSYYAGTVDGCTTCTGHAATTTYLRSGYFLTADFRPDQYYNMVSGLHITAPGTTSSIDAFSRLMWIKNQRYQAANNFTLSATPASQTVSPGGGTSYTVTVAPTGNFTGTIKFTAAGLPAGASASFSPATVTTSGSTTLSVTTGSSTPAGTYSLTITGSTGSITGEQTKQVSLVVSTGSSSTTAVNDNATGVTYAGTWTYSANRGLGDYSNDVHYTKTNGDSVSYTFTGTGIDYVTEKNTDEGNISFYIDGVLQATVSANSSSRQVQQVLYSASGLTNASHTFKAVKQDGTYMLIDELIVHQGTGGGTTDTNIAPTGTGYGWKANTSATADSNKSAQPGLNDNNLTANVDLNSAGDAVNAWEGAGVTWSTAKTISSAKFINGDITSGGDGFLTANLQLQFSTDGTTWTNSGWSVSPAYPYSSSAGGQTYTFAGTAVSGVRGARVVGQVRTVDTSYHWIVKEVQFIGH